MTCWDSYNSVITKWRKCWKRKWSKVFIYVWTKTKKLSKKVVLRQVQLCLVPPLTVYFHKRCRDKGCCCFLHHIKGWEGFLVTCFLGGLLISYTSVYGFLILSQLNRLLHDKKICMSLYCTCSVLMRTAWIWRCIWINVWFVFAISICVFSRHFLNINSFFKSILTTIILKK